MSERLLQHISSELEQLRIEQQETCKAVERVDKKVDVLHEAVYVGADGEGGIVARVRVLEQRKYSPPHGIPQAPRTPSIVPESGRGRAKLAGAISALAAALVAIIEILRAAL